jgi:hypothetical protein
MSSIKKTQQWRVYKPRKDSKGAASKLELKIVKIPKQIKGQDGASRTIENRQVQLFWVAAKQTGMDNNDNAAFAWNDESQNVTMKLGESDIGEILAALNRIKKQAGTDRGIYHTNPNGSTSMQFQNVGEKGFSLRLAKKIGNTLTEVKHMISLGEAEILKTLLFQVVRTTYQW